MAEFVINPETGRVAQAVVSFIDIERKDVEQPLLDSQARVTELDAEITDLQTALSAKVKAREDEVAAQADLKSALADFDTTANDTPAATGSEGASGEAPAFAPAEEVPA